jgi:hypothetical protein
VAVTPARTSAARALIDLLIGAGGAQPFGAAAV